MDQRYIRKISRIDDFGVFQNWKWKTSPQIQEPLLKKTTVIYGANGTGKSTLANLLADEDMRATSGIVLGLADSGDGGESEVRGVDKEDPLWGRLRIFGEKYRDENLRFDGDDVSATHLLTLGKKAIETQEERHRIGERMREIEEELESLEKERRSADNSCQTIERDNARMISELCGPGDEKYGGRRYHAGSFRDAVDNRTCTPLDGASQNPDEDKKLIRQDNLPRAPDIPSPKFDLAQEARNVKDLLASSITSNLIDVLKDNHEAEEWVQQGLHLHEERSECLFCGGEYDEDRYQRLSEHFDASFTDLQEKIDATRRKLQQAANQLKGARDSLPPELQGSFEGDYRKAREELSEAITSALEWLSSLDEQLAEKKSRMATPVDLKTEKEAPWPSFGSAKGIIESHNHLAEHLEEKKREAAGRLEAALINEVLESYLDERHERDRAEGELRARQDEKRDLEAKLRTLQDQDTDPYPLAEKLTNELALLLGRSEIEVLPADGEDGKYTITRNGEPAKRLSDGERNAIALLHFLCSLDEDIDESAPGPPIVIVDDPVSSLDNPIMLGASTHLWNRLHERDDIQQVILLTHNFEFLRVWMNSLGDRGSVLELRARSLRERDEVRREPLFIRWPTNRNKRQCLRSEYHYLFWRTVTTLVECVESMPNGEAELEAVMLVPNAARKMLEGFVAFRAPEHVGELEKGVRHLAKQYGASPVHTSAITKHLHIGSHYERVEPEREIQPDVGVHALVSVCEFMSTVDSSHMEEMCRAVDVDDMGLEVRVKNALASVRVGEYG